MESNVTVYKGYEKNRLRRLLYECTGEEIFKSDAMKAEFMTVSYNGEIWNKVTHFKPRGRGIFTFDYTSVINIPTNKTAADFAPYVVKHNGDEKDYLVQAWPVTVDDKFREQFEMVDVDKLREREERYDPQKDARGFPNKDAIEDFRKMLKGLFAEGTATGRIYWCNHAEEKLDHTVFKAEAKVLCDFLTDNPGLMRHYFRIRSVTEGSKWEISSRGVKCGHKEFKFSDPRVEYALYFRDHNGMACIQPWDMFAEERWFYNASRSAIRMHKRSIWINLSKWQDAQTFWLEKKLGAGAFGEVVCIKAEKKGNTKLIEAEGPLPNKRYALKLFTSSRNVPEKVVEREAEVVSKVSGPFLPITYAFFSLPANLGSYSTQDGKAHLYGPYAFAMIMMLADRGDLNCYACGKCDNNGMNALTADWFEEVRRLMAELTEGLRILHCHNVVHRDIKPDNLLLRQGDDGNVHVYICDFGTAKIGVTIGTCSYAAPEVYRTGTYTKECDLHGSGSPSTSC